MILQEQGWAEGLWGPGLKCQDPGPALCPLLLRCPVPDAEIQSAGSSKHAITTPIRQASYDPRVTAGFSLWGRK